MSEFLIFDAQGDDVGHEAYVVCSPDWREKIRVEGESVLTWQEEIWNRYTPCCFTEGRLQQLRQMHPGFLKYRPVRRVYESAQSKGYQGDADLPSVAQWAGCSGQFDVGTPLGRCRLMAAIMRSAQMR